MPMVLHGYRRCSGTASQSCPVWNHNTISPLPAAAWFAIVPPLQISSSFSWVGRALRRAPFLASALLIVSLCLWSWLWSTLYHLQEEASHGSRRSDEPYPSANDLSVSETFSRYGAHVWRTFQVSDGGPRTFDLNQARNPAVHCTWMVMPFHYP